MSPQQLVSDEHLAALYEGQVYGAIPITIIRRLDAPEPAIRQLHLVGA